MEFGSPLIVNMPWASLDRPSIALAALKNAVADQCGAHVSTLHANLLWAKWLLGLDEPVPPAQFDDYGLDSYFLGFGDWVFTSALYSPDWKREEFASYAESVSKDPEPVLKLHELAPLWIDELARSILENHGPPLVGFTTTFQQTVASLALARRLKELAPETIVVMGGANCDGEQGAAIQRNFGHLVDYVIRGEGEIAFPQLLTVLAGELDEQTVPGLCWTTDEGVSVANEMAKETVDMTVQRPPDYDEYFNLLESSGLDRFVRANLVLESSRGCWWGQKHHCTFCGLNGTYMTYRAKAQEQFIQEVEETVERYRTLDIYVVDNILDMKYFQRVLPELAKRDWDLHIQYEIKSSLRRHQLQALFDAGALSLQPGIENLDDHVLKLMDKGVKGTQNVRILREGKNVGLDISWNYLYGFPGETEENYKPILDQMPALFHLQPPRVASPIAVERFSPYFSQPALGFTDIEPNYYYSLLFDLPIGELFDIAYLFQAERHGIQGATEARLVELTDQWRDEFYESRLTEWDFGERIELANSRSGFDWRRRTIADPTELTVYRRMHEPTTLSEIVESCGLEEPAARKVLADWVEAGLIFGSGETWITIATESTGIECVSRSDIGTTSTWSALDAQAVPA